MMDHRDGCNQRDGRAVDNRMMKNEIKSAMSEKQAAVIVLPAAVPGYSRLANPHEH